MDSPHDSIPTGRLHIVGRKNSGKTTLIVDLVERLTARGLRIGTIKHTHHRHELDTPGKDSHRHRQAGAAMVGILSPGMDALFIPRTGPTDDDRRYERMLSQFSDCDLVLIEGNLSGPGPKIEMWRAAMNTPPIAASDPSICVLVSDDPIPVDKPCWRRSDVEALADMVLQFASRPKADPSIARGD